MSEYSDRNRLNLKENNLSLSLNTSFSSNKSFYDSLEDHTKRDILFLIKSGYNKKAVIKLYLIVKPAHVSEAIEYLSKKDGLYQHIFYSNSNYTNKCEICGNKRELHIEEPEKTIISLNKSNQDDVSFIDVQKDEKIEEKLFKEKYECRICEDVLTKNQINICQKCKSFFCSECLYEHAKELVKNGKVIGCPYCFNEYNEDRVMKILNYNKADKIEIANLKSLYKKNKLKFFVLSNPDLVFCPIANCDGYAKKNKSSLKNKCNNGHEFCIRCGEFWHQSGNCPEDEVVDELFRNYCEKLRLKDCPSCGITTFKKDGCNHITCTYCRQNWCWICEEVFLTVEEHYQNPNSNCYQRMLEGIIQIDMCQKCETPRNENSLINFRNCQHLICKKCIESFLLQGGEFKIRKDDEVKLRCPMEDCNNNQTFSYYQFFSIIRRINNKTITTKYKKDVFQYEIKRFKIKNFFSFQRADEFRESADDILKKCNYKKVGKHCHRCSVVANLWLSLFICFFMIIVYTTPMLFQSLIRDLFHKLASIMSRGKNKYLKIPIIMIGEILAIIYFIFSFGIYYIYMVVYIAHSCCFS